VLEAGGGLDRGDDLARHAELGERAERRLLVVTEVADGLVEPDQAFLDEILSVTAGEEVRARLQPDEAGVPPDEVIQRGAVAVARLDDELEILELTLRLLLSAGARGWTGGGHGHTGLRRFAVVPFASAKVAPISRNYKNSAKVPFVMDPCPFSALLASPSSRVELVLDAHRLLLPVGLQREVTREGRDESFATSSPDVLRTSESDETRQTCSFSGVGG
jgi:hypothetical protein